MLLKAIAKSVSGGKIIIQIKFPDDEQCNPIISKKPLKKTNKSLDDIIRINDIGKDRLFHPETEMDYIYYYESIVKEND